MVQKAAHDELERVVRSCDSVTWTQTLYGRIVGEDINTPFIFDALPFYSRGRSLCSPLSMGLYDEHTCIGKKCSAQLPNFNH